MVLSPSEAKHMDLGIKMCSLEWPFLYLIAYLVIFPIHLHERRFTEHKGSNAQGRMST